MRLAYLYSRYPVLSQTFCDTEMLALEELEFSLVIGAIHPPLTTIRHPHAGKLRAPVHYAPPLPILQLWEEKMRQEKRWPETLIATHNSRYGPSVKAALRARNATYFANLFARSQVNHFHVHFANRAAHTALFLKAMSNIPFSVTAHGQDFMTDLGNDDLLREICDAAEFVAVETEYSRGMMAQRCPASAHKIHRVYNGMNLANFLRLDPSVRAGPHIQILSVGRLVTFKGFEYLIEACHQLRQRSLQFHCQIIGDGPLRKSLQSRISELRLDDWVSLQGALPQDRIVEMLQSCDIFALASTVDDAGASDIFPTVILEAMASACPVVSTTVAGIPEAVVNKETGLLVPPGETGLFADALEVLCRHRELRHNYGIAGRARIENHFQISRTVQPLVQLLERKGADPQSPRILPSPDRAGSLPPGRRIAFVIDRWPDNALSSIELELLELKKQNLEVTVFVCEFVQGPALTAAMKRLALQWEFLPDAMAIEAEWQVNRRLVLALEDDRANENPRVPVDDFLRQARFAITLRRMFIERNVVHVHTTSSGALICGVLLKKLLGITLSASIEAKPQLSFEVIQNSLRHAVGGRVADSKLLKQLGPPFVLDQANNNRFWRRSLRWLMPNSRIESPRHRRFWQEWAVTSASWNTEA